MNIEKYTRVLRVFKDGFIFQNSKTLNILVQKNI